MSFNYAKEKSEFDKEWKSLKMNYLKAGMKIEMINEIYEFDLCWFRMRRNYDSRVMSLPEEGSEKANTLINAKLLQKYIELVSEQNEMKFTNRHGWIEDISDSILYTKLKTLSKDELELLTLTVIEGFSQREIARFWGCSQNAISKMMLRLKRFLKNN